MEQDNRGDDLLDSELVSLSMSELKGGKIDIMEADWYKIWNDNLQLYIQILNILLSNSEILWNLLVSTRCFDMIPNWEIDKTKLEKERERERERENCISILCVNILNL